MADMHPALRTFFDTHQAKTCACKRQVHDDLGPIMQTMDGVTNHLNDLQTKLTMAELAEHDHALDGKLQWMHTRLEAGLIRAAAVRTAVRDMAKVLVEVEESFSQDVIDLNFALSGKGPPVASVPVVETVVT